MGLFSRRDKKKKGFFGRKNRVEEPEEASILQQPDAAESEPEAQQEEDIAGEAIAQQEAEERQWEETARKQAEELAEQESMRQEAAALAAEAARAAREAEEAAQQDAFATTYTPLATKREEPDTDLEPEQELEETQQPESVGSEVPVEAVPELESHQADAAPEEADTETIEESEEAMPEEAEVTEGEETEEPEAEPEAEPVQVSVPEKKKGFFAKIREGLKKTKDSMIAKMQHVLNSFTKIDEDLFEQLEETMIMSDLGPETSVEICDLLRKRVKEEGITDPSQIMRLIQEIIGEMLGEDTGLDLSTKPSIIMVIGVNGAGKTTTIGKLCHQLKEDDKKVIVAAADTFRAAAIDQLEVWTNRAGVELVKHAEGSDPGAVVFDAIAAAKARDCDVLICDTAGRLHNKKNLMQELAKINRIIETQAEGCSVEVLLVLDATTGQNAVNQARLFQEVANLTGIVLTKLDGTAKGGIIVSIRNELHIPVKLIGVGEKIDDLQPFRSKDFVAALFDRETEEK